MRERTYRHRRTGARVRERRVTSAHEAAHTAVALALGLTVDRCGLESVADGYCDTVEAERVGAVIDVYRLCLDKPAPVRMRLRRALRPLVDDDELRRSAVVAAAAHVAETMLLGRATAGTVEDDDELLAVAELLGIVGRRNVDRFFRECDNAAKLILVGNRKGVAALAESLRQRRRVPQWRRVGGKEAKRILAAGILRNSTVA